MKSLTLEELKQIVQENGKLKGWDFSGINTGYDPVPWDYVSLARLYLKPTDRVLDIGSGGGEIFLSLAPNIRQGIGIDHNPAMIDTAQSNQVKLGIDHIKFVEMEARDLKFGDDEFDIVLLRHVSVPVREIVRVLRPGGYFISQQVGKRSSKNFLDAFGWTSDSFGPNWWQSVRELVLQFQDQGCHIVVQGEYDLRYWFEDLASFMFWLLAVPWPEAIKLEKHWQNINQILKACTTNRGIETNEHRGLLIVQKKRI